MTDVLTTNGDEHESALLVQTARSVEYANGTIVLRDISPSTLYVSHRTDQIIGHIGTTELVAFWCRERSRFAKSPPVAALSFVGQDSPTHDDVVLRISSPVLDNQSLIYSASVLEGNLCRQSGPCTLFIDALGRPVSPVSFTASLRLVRDRNRWAARQPDFLESLASL